MQLSPHLAASITNTFAVKATFFYKLFYDTEQDEVICLKAKELGNIFILNKDKDFADLPSCSITLPKTIFLNMQLLQ